MDNTIINMIASHIDGQSFEGKDILEIGSREVSGPSVRNLFRSVNPKRYHGIDLVDGKGVDEVISLVKFAEVNKDKFDCVICTEVFEHYEEWWELLGLLPNFLKDRGTLVFSTPGVAFPFHAHEWDFWRADPDNLKTLFGCLCDDMHRRESFITQSSDKKHIFAKVEFQQDTFDSRKTWYDFMLNNMKVYNIMIGEKVSKKEWIELKRN